MDKEPDFFLQDVLRDVTRKERRNLLGVASVGIVVVWQHIPLSDVSILGLSLKNICHDQILFLVGLAVIYFLVAFVVHALVDLVK